MSRLSGRLRGPLAALVLTAAGLAGCVVYEPAPGTYAPVPSAPVQAGQPVPLVPEPVPVPAPAPPVYYYPYPAYYYWDWPAFFFWGWPHGGYHGGPHHWR